MPKHMHSADPRPNLSRSCTSRLRSMRRLDTQRISGQPAATGAHVEVGALNYGSALHTAHAERAPVMMIGGATARAYPGSRRGARSGPIHWTQERLDQRGLVADYVKWAFRLELQDNPGLVVSRGLQLALSAPAGPVFLSIPREVGMARVDEGWFPSAGSLGFSTPPAPDPATVDIIAAWLTEAERPLIIAGRAGRDPETVAELLRLVELVGAPVIDNAYRYALNLPASHALADPLALASDADVVLVVDRELPWVPAGARAGEEPLDSWAELPLAHPARAPSADCKVACVGLDPVAAGVTLLELSADLRVVADPRLALRSLADAVADRIGIAGRRRAQERIAAASTRHAERWRREDDQAKAVARSRPIDPHWLCYELGRWLDPEAVLLDEAVSNSHLVGRYCRQDRPGSFLSPAGTGGGWGSGAALGVKLAEPSRQVVLVSGDGFYANGVPSVAVSTAARQQLGYIAVVLVNGSYSTGTTEHAALYPGGYSERAGFPGGQFEPAPDFAAEAVAAGGFGITVDEPADVGPALGRALDVSREGQPCVVAVRIA